MEFYKMLGMARNKSINLADEMEALIRADIGSIHQIGEKILCLSETDDADERDRKIKEITGELLNFIKSKLLFPKEYDHEYVTVHKNALIQGCLGYLYISDSFPSFDLKMHVEYLAKQINVPEILDDSLLIKRLARKLEFKDVSLIANNSHIRIRNSQGSGVNAMRVQKGKEKSGSYERRKRAVYDRAYIEAVSILKGIFLLEEKGIIDGKIFWEKLKKWGKGRITRLVEGPMEAVFSQYKELKYIEQINLDNKNRINYIDEFLIDMARVHEQYIEFILSGQLKENFIKTVDLYNNKFYFYLHLMYEYVKYYSNSEYRYLAIYSLERIYAANTIAGIRSLDINTTIYKEFIPTRKYAMSDLDSWIVHNQNPMGKYGRIQREDENNKNIFYIHKMQKTFFRFLFTNINYKLKSEYLKDYDENLLTYINTRLEKDLPKWEMIRDTSYSPTKLDFYLWFLYRPFVLEAQYMKKTEEFFKEVNEGERMLSFICDWENIQDEIEIEREVATLLKKSKQSNERKNIADIIEKVRIRSECDKTLEEICIIFKDAVEPEKEILKYIRNERESQNQKKIDKVFTFLKEFDLIENQCAMDSIVGQIYEAPYLGKALDKLCDDYIEEVKADAEKVKRVSMKGINEKMGIKVQSHNKLMRNIYVKIYMESDETEIRALLKRYQLSFWKPLIRQKDVQFVIKDIIRQHRVCDTDLLFYATYLRRASWLPKEDVDFMFDKILPRRI